MLEIEKIQKLHKLVQTEDQKNEIKQAEEILENAFRDMIEQTREYLINGSAERIDSANIAYALSVLKRYGDAYGVEFTECNDKRDTLMYVITYARQIIYGADDECQG